ncbi:MAG TPA: hypothetical protein PLE30_03295 [Candidatus Kapabacteria bacterium]|nr:hypothetical protein [Candidatus Kapabacteria bacterium]
MNNRQFYEAPSSKFAMELLSYLPPRPDYETWLKVISAIGNTFPKIEADYIIKSKWRDEKPNETNYKLRNTLKNVNFGTLVYFAKQYGYSFEKSHTNGNRATLKQNHSNYHRPQEKALKSHTNGNRATLKQNHSNYHRPQEKALKSHLELEKFEKPIYQHPENSFLPEFVKDVLQEYEKDGLTSAQAREITLNNADWLQDDRVFRVAINDKILNKNLHPETREKLPSFDFLTYGFKNMNLTINQIADMIGKGYAILPSQLIENQDGATHRKTANFKFSELVIIDIDNADENKNKLVENYLSVQELLEMPQTRKAIMIYTTPSHTKQWHRLRIVFPLPRLITDPEIYKSTIKEFIKIYKSDQQTSNITNAFYGNHNATIILLSTGEMIQYKKGKRLC